MKVLRVAAIVAAALLGAGAASGAPEAHRVPDTMARRVQVCAACHGKEGRATREGYFPRIAGKPAGYLYNQLVNFRDGRRSNATMTYLVEHLSDAYLKEIAEHFAALDLPYPPPPSATRSADAQALARGEALALRGDASRQIPACARCHGAALTGVTPGIPGLLGLPRDYVMAQLGAWKTKQRRAVHPDCMAQIAERLAADDVSAVATWLAAQPVPSLAQPAGAIALPLPLPCGSQ